MLEALRQGMGRHQRRAFWEATIAVCALIAAPEGKVSFATRVRIDNILDNLPDLRIFDTNEFVELFDRFVDEFRVSPRKARTRALDVARKGASDADEAELLARIAIAVADTGVDGDHAGQESIQTLCKELGVDPKVVSAAASANENVEEPEQPAARKAEALRQPAAHKAAVPHHLKSVDVTPEEEPQMQEEIMSGQETEVAVAPTPSNGPGPQAPVASVAPVVNDKSSTSDLSQQLQVDGTKAVIALCGRTKTGSLEALRIYENEQFAAADCALSEKIANEKFWLSPVTLFPSDKGASNNADDSEPTPIHVMCLSRPDGSVEALRAFASADHANADLEFFRNISNDKMWVSVVQFKTVA